MGWRTGRGPQAALPLQLFPRSWTRFSEALSSGHVPADGRGEGPVQCVVGWGGQGSLCFPSSSAWHTICPHRTNLTRSRHCPLSKSKPSPSARPKETASPALPAGSLSSSSPLSLLNSSLLSPPVPPPSWRFPGFPNSCPEFLPHVPQGHPLAPWLFTWQRSAACLPDATPVRGAGDPEMSPPLSLPARSSQLRSKVYTRPPGCLEPLRQNSAPTEFVSLPQDPCAKAPAQTVTGQVGSDGCLRRRQS